MKKRPFSPKVPLDDPKQELFCVLYTSNSTPRFFGHGQFSYAFAYGHQDRIDAIRAKMPVATTTTGRGKKKLPSQYAKLEAELKGIENGCRASSTRLLTRANIRDRCNFLMDSLFTDEIMDRELVYVIQQRHDLQSKVRAWEQAAKLKQRIQDRSTVHLTFDPIKTIRIVTPAKK